MVSKNVYQNYEMIYRIVSLLLLVSIYVNHGSVLSLRKEFFIKPVILIGLNKITV